MIYDRYDNPITSDGPATAAAFDLYTESLLAYGQDLPSIITAADDDPGCATLNAHAAAVHMAYEAASGYRAATPYLKRAVAGSDRVTERERLFIEAVAAWANRDFETAIDRHQTIAQRWPSDLAAAKWGQYHAFNLGRAECLLDIAERVVKAVGEAPYVHGMRAFGLEQMHRLKEAEEAGRHAVEIERIDPWAHHAVAHVMETEGRVDEGLDFMRALSDTWAGLGVFIRHHNWWHIALFHIDRDEPQAALEVFDRYLWGVLPDFCQEQIGAIAALWRLELRGVDVGDRWDRVISKVREREFEHVQPFHDLHYVYALGRGGHREDLTRFLASMEHHCETVAAGWAPAWQTVALPVAKALASYTEGRFGMTASGIGPCLDQLHLIGGSHAQRDIFHQTHIDALVQCGDIDRAARLLEARQQARPDVPCLTRLLEDVRRGTGNTPLAEAI